MKKVLLLIPLLALILGCSTKKILVKPPLADIHKSKDEYVIGVGDMLQVNVWRNPELSVSIPVRPDGRISTPLVGDVQASGATPIALASSLKEKLESYVRNPEVTVIVTSPRSIEYIDRVRVVGAVGAPRSIPFREGMTVLDLVLEAGGVSAFASANKALLYRTNDAGERNQYPVYLDDIFSDGNLESNYKLQPLDIITVPERLF